MGPDGGLVRWSSRVGGRPAAIVVDGGDPARARDLADDLRARRLEADVHLVTGAPEGLGEADFLDDTGQARDSWGIDASTGSVVVILDHNVRVVMVGPARDPSAAELVAGHLAARSSHATSARAPVLTIPDAIRASMADRVRSAWEEADPVATGVETTADGRRIEALDGLAKRRRDHVVRDPVLLRDLTQHVGRRVIPQVHKAFAFRATGFEGFKVGAYDQDDQGFFAAHRDNLSPATAHRRFALSLVLDDEHEGGELVFPEYSGHGHRLGRFEALVFSCSLLHAVRPVTSGRRLVLLSFLLGPAGPG